MNPSLLAGIALVTVLCGCQSAGSTHAHAPERGATDAEKQRLAKALANPLGDVINVPISVNTYHGIGPADADQTEIEIEPVVPFSISADWDLITRTNVTFIGAESPASGGGDESGLGDVVESLFFSPKQETEAGWMWGVGPVFLLPTAADDELGSGKWAAGPTAALLKEELEWTYGVLANHLWSFAGDEDRPYVDATCVQPFASYTTKSNTTLSVNTQSTYDWRSSQWTVPLTGQISQLLHGGELPISIGVGYTGYAEKPDGGPNWELCFALTLVFPD